jgi:hypothetical protein
LLRLGAVAPSGGTMPFGCVCVPKLVRVSTGNDGDLIMGMRIELVDGSRPVELLEEVLTHLGRVTPCCAGGPTGVLQLLRGGVGTIGQLLAALL